MSRENPPPAFMIAARAPNFSIDARPFGNGEAIPGARRRAARLRRRPRLFLCRRRHRAVEALPDEGEQVARPEWLCDGRGGAGWPRRLEMAPVLLIVAI